MADNFRSITLKASETLKACTEELYRKYKPLAFASNPRLLKQNYWHFALDVWSVPCSLDQKVKWSEEQREKHWLRDGNWTQKLYVH